MNAVIYLDVPDWQIGQDVSVYFPDTMLKHGKCEMMKEQGCATITEPDCRICGQSHCKYYHETRKPTECKSYVRMDSLECLEPLTPVKIQTLFSGHFGKRRIVHGKCPVCLTMLNNMDQPNYCSVCGKAVEWDA